MRNKTIIAFLVTMLLTAGITACSGESETTNPSPANTGTTPVNDDVAWSADGTITDGEYGNTFQAGSYELHWTTDGETVYFGIRVQTDGWVALGFQPGNAMKDADLVIGFVEDGQANVSDQFSTGSSGPHSADTEQGGTDDILASGGATDGDFTIIEFSRLMQTGDELDVDLQPGDNQIIWSYGSSDDTGRQHSNRGYGTISL